MDLQQSLKTLATARRTEEIISNHIADIQTTIENTPAWRALAGFKRDLAAVKDNLAAAEEAAKQAALAHFQEHNDKHPTHGVQIKLYKRIQCHDVAATITWCKEHAPLFVEESLTREFNSVADTLAKAGAPITITYEPHPQIAADLSQYLQDEAT
jgi:hypothetical protein